MTLSHHHTLIYRLCFFNNFKTESCIYSCSFYFFRTDWKDFYLFIKYMDNFFIITIFLLHQLMYFINLVIFNKFQSRKNIGKRVFERTF